MSKSYSGGKYHQKVYSITSADHFDFDARMSTLLTKSKEQDHGSISLLNRIAKHILKLDNTRDERKRELLTIEVGSKRNKSEQIRGPTLPSPRNVEGALASPFYDPDFWLPRRPLAPNRVYHFHVIYNHAHSSLGLSSDTDLALRVTASLVEKLELRGYVNGYYHDRDRRTDQPLGAELERVITGSSLTILLLTPGFVRDCLDRYLQVEAFRRLLTGQDSTNGQLVIMGVGVTQASLPLVLGRHEVLFFKTHDWEVDHPAWARLDNALLGLLGQKHRMDTLERTPVSIGETERKKRDGLFLEERHLTGLQLTHHHDQHLPTDILPTDSLYQICDLDIHE
ncbi:hypothetical protein EGW08_012056, partial [Elysia chlorotica]